MNRFLLAGCLAAGLQVPVEHTKDSLDQVKAAMAKKDAVLVDVREKVEWDEGHVDGALFLALSWLREKSAQDDFSEALAGRLRPSGSSTCIAGPVGAP